MGHAKIVLVSNLLKGLFLVFAALVFWPPNVFSQNDKIPREVLDLAETDGTALVLVGLRVPWRMEDTLTENAVAAQRQAIGGTQDNLLAELSGTHYRIVRRYQVIPSIALEVGADALAVLKKSGSVTNVLPDRPGRQATKDGVTEGAPPETRGAATVSVGMVPAELFIEATSAGAVLVLVGLKTPWSPEGPLSKELVLAQREAIAAAQNYLLTELADTRYRITRRYEVIPGIALEVGLDALRVLARSVAVTNVLRDRPAMPLR